MVAAIPLSEPWRTLVFAIVVALVLGSLVSLLRNVTYRLYVGSTCWPRWLFDAVRARQAKRILNLSKAANDAKQRRDTLRYDELWRQLRMFPLDAKGEPRATHPTLLGNIVAAYEEYPVTRYGMDPVFYFPRIWMQLEKERKEEIDASWSKADGLLSLSAVSFLGGTLWICAVVLRMAGLSILEPRPPLEDFLVGISSGLSLFVLGYLLYRISLGFHVLSGETFKAIFDLYRERLEPMSKFGPDESERWKTTWAYLQYLTLIGGGPTEGAKTPQLISGAIKRDAAKGSNSDQVEVEKGS